MFVRARKSMEKLKRRMMEINFDNLVWLINKIPNLIGSARNDEIAGPFWYIHLSLLFYVYGAGSVAYQLKHTVKSEDFFKSNVNAAMIILIGNMSWWWMTKRSLLRTVLKGIEESDRIAGTAASEHLKKKHSRILRKIKNIIIVFNVPQLFEAFFLYIPRRMDVEHSFSMGMVPCVGLEPITSTPNKEICKTIIVAQELSLILTALHYQTMLIFLIAYTAGMFHILTQEMMDLNNYENLEEHKYYVRKHLPSLVKRHALMLQVVGNLKNLYSVSTGVDFGANSVCICLLFFVSYQELLKFIPLLVYCVLSFFMYCFLCQRMTNAAENFKSAIYSCGWENFDLREQKLVYIMLLIAQKPVVILAADNVPVNMYTFATTLKFLYKFVTVIKY